MLHGNERFPVIVDKERNMMYVVRILKYTDFQPDLYLWLYLVSSNQKIHIFPSMYPRAVNFRSCHPFDLTRLPWSLVVTFLIRKKQLFPLTFLNTVVQSSKLFGCHSSLRCPSCLNSRARKSDLPNLPNSDDLYIFSWLSSSAIYLPPSN